MSTPTVIAPIKCGNCGQVTVFEVRAPMEGTKSFSFDCPNGHPVTDAKGRYVVVDLRDYNQAKLKRVIL